MHSFIIVASDKQTRDNYIQQFCRKYTIDPFDKTIIASEKSLGIDDIRAMQKKLFFKPLKSKQKIVVIENADTATITTQNALLKLLEEPPAHTIMMLTATTDNPFLPTILSRCTIVRLEENENPSQESLEKTKQELQKLLSASTGTKLYAAQNLAANKETTAEQLTYMLHAARLLLLEEINSKGILQYALTYMNLLEQLQKAYTMLTTTNINPRFLLEQTLLKIHTPLRISSQTGEAIPKSFA